MRLVIEVDGDRYVDAQQWTDASGVHGHLKNCLHHYVLEGFIGYDVKLLFQMLDRQLPTSFAERMVKAGINQTEAWQKLRKTINRPECVDAAILFVRSDAEMSILIADIVEHLFAKGKVYLTDSKEPSSHELWLKTIKR